MLTKTQLIELLSFKLILKKFSISHVNALNLFNNVFFKEKWMISSFTPCVNEDFFNETLSYFLLKKARFQFFKTTFKLSRFITPKYRLLDRRVKPFRLVEFNFKNELSSSLKASLKKSKSFLNFHINYMDFTTKVYASFKRQLFLTRVAPFLNKHNVVLHKTLSHSFSFKFLNNFKNLGVNSVAAYKFLFLPFLNTFKPIFLFLNLLTSRKRFFNMYDYLFFAYALLFIKKMHKLANNLFYFKAKGLHLVKKVKIFNSIKNIENNLIKKPLEHYVFRYPFSHNELSYQIGSKPVGRLLKGRAVHLFFLANRMLKRKSAKMLNLNRLYNSRVNSKSIRFFLNKLSFKLNKTIASDFIERHYICKLDGTV